MNLTIFTFYIISDIKELQDFVRTIIKIHFQDFVKTLTKS